MGTPPQLRPDPPRVLLVTGDLARASAFSGVAAGYAEPVCVEAVAPDVLGTTARPDSDALGARFGAVVVDRVDAELSEQAIGALRSAAIGGCRVVLIAGEASGWSRGLAELAGARPAALFPLGEWFAKPCFAGGWLTARFPAEMPLDDSLVELSPGPDASAVLAVSIGFRDRVVATDRPLGRGGVFVCGMRGEGRRGFAPALAQLLRRALAGPPGEAPRSALGLAVVGYGPYGGMGLYHGLAAEATDGLEFVAACDSDPGRLKAAEEQFPRLRTKASTDELAADEGVQVVVVATPPSTHFPIALEMVRAGKHVALEKPMCLSLKEADRLIEAAESEQVAVTVHQSRRFDPDFVTLRRAVDDGLVGDVFNVETFVGGFEHPCRAWHSEVAVSGGAVYDWGAHHLDWILELMGGFPETLAAHGHKRVWHDVTNLDQVRVRLTWADGREAEFLQSDVAGVRRPKFFVQGTRGTLAGWYRPLHFERLEPGLGYVGEHAHHAEAPVELTLARYEAGYGITETRLLPTNPDRFAFHRNLADHLLLGEPLFVEPPSARRVVALLEAAQRSTDQGNATVTLPQP